MAFIPKFISKEYKHYIINSITTAFKHAIIEDKKLKMDVGVILSGMILKHIKNENEQNKLLERIDMAHIKSDMEQLVYYKYGEELEKKDKENNKLKKENRQMKKETDEIKKENREMKKGIRELHQIENLTPEAKKIINTLIVI